MEGVDIGLLVITVVGFLAGLLIIIMGFYYLFSDASKINKMVQWFSGFTLFKPMKKLEGRSLKAIRINGLAAILLGIMLSASCAYFLIGSNWFRF